MGLCVYDELRGVCVCVVWCVLWWCVLRMLLLARPNTCFPLLLPLLLLLGRAILRIILLDMSSCADTCTAMRPNAEGGASSCVAYGVSRMVCAVCFCVRGAAY